MFFLILDVQSYKYFFIRANKIHSTTTFVERHTSTAFFPIMEIFLHPTPPTLDDDIRGLDGVRIL